MLKVIGFGNLLVLNNLGGVLFVLTYGSKVSFMAMQRILGVEEW